MSTPATIVSLPVAAGAHAAKLGMLPGKRYRPNYVISADGLEMRTEFVEIPDSGSITFEGATPHVTGELLPLSGGTMTGGINFGGGTAVTSPEDLSKCLHFYDGNVELGMSVTGNTLNFVATQADDHFDFRVASTTVVRVGNTGIETFGSTSIKTPRLFVAGVEILPSSGGVTTAQMDAAIAAAITALKADPNAIYAFIQASGLPVENAVIPAGNTITTQTGLVIRGS